MSLRNFSFIFTLFIVASLNLSFSYQVKVNRLIILIENLTPDLFKGLYIEEFLLSKLGVICKVETTKELSGCFRFYIPKEIWFVYLGHFKANQNYFNPFFSIKNLKFPQKIDYAFLDGCFSARNKSLISVLKPQVKKGIYAWLTKAPYSGFIPIFKNQLWNKPDKAITFINNFYNNTFEATFILPNSPY